MGESNGKLTISHSHRERLIAAGKKLQPALVKVMTSDAGIVVANLF